MSTPRLVGRYLDINGQNLVHVVFEWLLIRNNLSQKFGVEYWTLPDSNSPWQSTDNRG